MKTGKKGERNVPANAEPGKHRSPPTIPMDGTIMTFSSGQVRGGTKQVNIDAGTLIDSGLEGTRVVFRESRS